MSKTNAIKKRMEHYSWYVYVVSLILVMGALVTGICFTVGVDLTALPEAWVGNIAIDILGMSVALILLFSQLLEMRQGNAAARTIARILTSLALNLFVDLCCWCFDGRIGSRNLVILFNSLFYMIGYLVILFFWKYLCEEFELNRRIFHILNRICVAVVLCGEVAVILNLFFGYFFTVSEEAIYIRSPLNLLGYLPPFILMAIVFGCVVTRHIAFRQKLVLLSYEILPFAAMLIQYFVYGLSIIYPAVLLATLLVYTSIHLAKNRILLEQEAEIGRQNAALMISQIQPHFLYNTLTTISNLCTKNPKEAEETTVMFSRYLRMNLDSLRNLEPVPFAQEMDHVQTYLLLEKKRFGEKLQITLDIDDVDFLVPSLGIQPIAENSVKHGIRMKEDEGHLHIASRRVPGGHEVVIEDDGVGFDPSAPMPDDGRSHVGMNNVRERLRQMCSATMEITSKPGEGCKTILFFPDR